MKTIPLALLPLLLALFSGCATPDAGQDALVIRSEQITDSTFEACDAFLRWEKENRPTAPPAVAKLADKIRDEAPALIRAARSLTRAYKQSRSQEDANALQTLLATLEALRSSVLAILTPAPAAAIPGQALAVAPLVVVALIDGIMRLIAVVSGMITAARRTKEWTPEEEALIDAKMQDAFKADHWKKSE